MIERVERYVFSMRPGQADLLHAWADAADCSPEQLAYRLLMVGVTVAGERLLGWEPARWEHLQDEAYQADVLANLRIHLELDRGE